MNTLSGKQSTSEPEQTLLYYISKIYKDATGRFLIDGKIEADVYIPSINVAVEYDGAHWHKNKKLRDDKKNFELNSREIYVIHVREAGLPELEEFNGKVFIHGTKKIPGLHTNEYVTAVIHELFNRTQDVEIKEKAERFNLSFEELLEDESDILSHIYTSKVENNVDESYVGQFWDKQKNKKLNPQNVPVNSSIRVWFCCPEKKSVRFRVKDVAHECQWECADCDYLLCPFIEYCYEECLVFKNTIDQMLRGKRVDLSYHLESLITGTIFSNRYGGSLFHKFLNDEFTICERDNFMKLIAADYPGGKGIVSQIDYAKSQEDLEDIKKLQSEFPGRTIFIDPAKLDYDKEHRAMWLDYYEWLFSETDYDLSGIINGLEMLNYRVNISDELKNMVSQFLQSKSQVKSEKFVRTQEADYDQ